MVIPVTPTAEEKHMSEHTTLNLTDDRADAPSSADERLQLPAGVRKLQNGLGAKAGPGVWIWAGLGLTVAGFAAIFFSWVKVAETVNVGDQMPYVVSGATAGLALVVVGIAVVDMAVRRQDRLERRQQLTTMRMVLEELREAAENGTQGR